MAESASDGPVPTPAGAGSLRSRLKSGIFWGFLAMAFLQGSTFTSNIVNGRILGRTVYGEFSTIQGTLATLMIVVCLSMGFTATKFVAEFRLTDKQKASRVLGLCSLVTACSGCVACLVLLLGASWLAEDVLKVPQLVPGLRIAGIVVALQLYNVYQISALTGMESFRPMTYASLAAGGANFVLCTSGAYCGGVSGAVTGLAVGSLLQWAIFHRLLDRECAKQGLCVQYRGLWRERRVVLDFSLPGAIPGLTSMPALWACGALLVRLPNGLAQRALYDAANNLRFLVIYVPLITNRVVASFLNTQLGLGDERRYRKLFWANLGLTAVTVLAGAAVVALCGAWLLRCYGKDFVEGEPVLRILLLSTLFEGLATAVYQVIGSKGKMWLSLAVYSLPRDFAVLVAGFLLIPGHHAVGFAWAYCIAQAVSLVLLLISLPAVGLALPRSPGAPGGLAAGPMGPAPWPPGSTDPQVG